MFERLGQWWCKKMHRRAMWPIHGRYVCKKCLREYPITWVSTTQSEESPQPKSKRKKRSQSKESPFPTTFIR